MKRRISLVVGLVLASAVACLNLPYPGRAAEGRGATIEPTIGGVVHVEIERVDAAGSRVVSADGILRMLNADWVTVESNQGIGTVWFPRSRVTVIIVKP